MANNLLNLSDNWVIIVNDDEQPIDDSWLWLIMASEVW